MDFIRVTASQIRNTANQLREYNGYFDRQVQKLQESEMSLNGMWDGQANDAFHAAFNHDKDYMMQFYNLINKYCAALEQIAAEYERAENENINIAISRKNTAMSEFEAVPINIPPMVPSPGPNLLDDVYALKKAFEEWDKKNSNN